MYLEHFCLLISAEWSAVNTSSHSEAFERILMIFLIKKQAAWLFHLTCYWFPRRRFLVKSSVPKVAEKSLNIFEKFRVLTKLQAFSFTENYLLFFVFFQGDLRWSFAAVVHRWKSLKLVSASFFRIFVFHQMIALWKLWEIIFILSKKLLSFSSYSRFSIFVFLLFSPCQPLL